MSDIVLDLDNITLDKIRGMFIGLFLGDALGAPFEFRNKYEYHGLLEYVTKINTRAGPKRSAIGQVTDDSEMTLALLRTLINDGYYDRENVIKSYMKWAVSAGWSIGINTKQLLAYKKIKTYNRKIQEKIDNNNVSQSNGTLMRATPLALLSNHRYILLDCNITNPTSVNRDCSLLYVNSLKMGLNGSDPEEIYNWAKNHAKTSEVKKIFNDIENNIDRNVAENKGWVLNAFYMTYRSLISFDNYSDAMEWIIKEHPGSDTDTNACIAGALIGAILGFTKIENEPNQEYNIDILLSAHENNKYRPRPIEYTPYDFYELTEKACDFMIENFMEYD